MTPLPELAKRQTDTRRYPPGVGFMDGQYLPMHEAKISVLDYGFLHSDATYDVVHVWDGGFFRLEDHLDRFFAGMAQLYMTIPHDRAEITQIVLNCVALSGLRNAYVEIICTRGMSPEFSRDPRDAENRFIAFAIPFGSVANADQMREGLHAAVTPVVRIPPQSVDPTVKNYHWLDLIRGLYAAYKAGADTAILVDLNGDIAEGPGFNVFAVQDNKILTPGRGVLMGITRQTVFELCEARQIPCAADSLTIDALRAADEVFISSTAGGIMPVTRIDGAELGSGHPGAVTQQLTQAYWDLHKDTQHRLPVPYPDLA